jgi:SAM-dependent methyltransferase
MTLSFVSDRHTSAARGYLARRLVETPCPCCGAGSRPEDRLDFLRIERHLLPVRFSICRACGHVYTSRNLAGADLDQFYRFHYRRFYESVDRVSDAYVFASRDKLKAAYRFAEIARLVGPVGSVLEIGSGLGFFLDRCRRNGVRHVLGLELGEAFLRYSRDVLGLGDGVRATSYHSLGHLSFTPDLAALFHVLEHLEDPGDCLRWLRQMLAPEGTLVIEVPDIEGDWSSLGLSYFHIGHRSYFSQTSLSRLLQVNGFAPYHVTREQDDGIFPGNLRIYARIAAVPAVTASTPIGAEIEALRRNIAAKMRLWSLRCGLPHAAARRVVRTLRRAAHRGKAVAGS